MGLLLLDRADLQVKTEGESLALYEAGTRRGTVPIKLIDRCVVHGARTQFDSGMLLKLAEAGVSVVMMSPRQQRRVAMVLGPRHNDAAIRLAQTQRVLDPVYCQQWSERLVRAKLQQQSKTLQGWMAARPDARKPLHDAIDTVRLCRQQIGQSAPAASVAQLRGIEGAAARAYFAGLASVLPPALQFTGRNRRPPRDPVNACLSLGYTLLHAQAVQAAHAAGLDPLLGFYHRPAIGRESLASDLIEPLRSRVDEWVWQMVRQRDLREDHFTLDKGACLLGKAGRSVFYARWESMQPFLKRWLRQQSQGLARELREQGSLWLEIDSEDEEAMG